jgi:hypothetical protein
MVRIENQTRLLFSKPCTTWLLERGSHMELLFDKETYKIGIRPVKDNPSHTYKLYRGVSQSYLSLRAFIKFIGSPPDGIYPATFENEMLVINLGLHRPGTAKEPE